MLRAYDPTRKGAEMAKDDRSNTYEAKPCKLNIPLN